MQQQPKGQLDPSKYQIEIRKRQFVIVGLASQKGQLLNGRVCKIIQTISQDNPRYQVKINGDNTTYKIKYRNLVPKGYDLKTIHYPYEVMTLAEQEQIDKQICQAQKSIQFKKKPWELVFRQVEPQTNYCFLCQQFHVSCYDYCAYCGGDYLRNLHVGKNKLMQFYKRCHSCMTRSVDLNLAGVCKNCWKPGTILNQ